MSSLRQMLANIAEELKEKELIEPNWTGHDEFQDKVRQRIEAHIANDCLYGDDDDQEELRPCRVIALNWDQRKGDWK